jgi:hypothetical protein
VALGECVVKINEVIVEALNTGTGTPNPNTPKLSKRSQQRNAPATPTRSAPVDAEYQAQLDKNIQQKQQAELQANKIANPPPAKTIGQSIKKGIGAIGKGFKAGWQGAEKAAGATADAIGNMAQYVPGTQDRATKLASEQNAKPWVDRWLQGIRANPAINTPEQLQQFATKLVTNRAGQQLFQVPVPKDLSKEGVAEYLTSIVARISAGIETPTPALAKTTSVAPAQATPEPATQATPGGWITTPDGVQIKPASGVNPTFAKYNKQLYRLTNDDRWVDVRDKPVSQTMTAALNNALEQT